MGAGWANVKRRGRKMKKRDKNTARKHETKTLSKSKQRRKNKNA